MTIEQQFPVSRLSYLYLDLSTFIQHHSACTILSFCLGDKTRLDSYKHTSPLPVKTKQIDCSDSDANNACNKVERYCYVVECNRESKRMMHVVTI